MFSKKFKLLTDKIIGMTERIKLIFLWISMVCAVAVNAQNEDSLFIRKIYDEALVKGQAYENLRFLCKNIGSRITGSAEAEMAVSWGESVLKKMQLDQVYLQEIEIPHWERGTKEAAWISNENGDLIKVEIIALGGSIGTDGIMKAEVIRLEKFEDINTIDESKVKGKIVFYDQAFDQSHIQTFRAYGGCFMQRYKGAVEASKKGAVGVVIRSLASSKDSHPHTGSMTYEDGVMKIPAAALSTNSSDALSEMLINGKVWLSMEMDCRWFENDTSNNVIGELKGKKEGIISFGGHLDSWDIGEGAHDDGAGIVHCMEAIRILKSLNYKPNYTLRCVLFMNEENGNFGGKNYASIAHEKGEKHIAAIETDAGGFLPLGFNVLGNESQLNFIQGLMPILKEFELYRFEKGYSGVDVRPLLDFYPEMLQLGMTVNSQRYFDYHHSEEDVFENVNKRELELGAAAMAAMIYLVDKYYQP